MSLKQDTSLRLVAAAHNIINSEVNRALRSPGAHDDAEAELLDDRLLIAAREFVEAHEGVEALPG